MRLNEIVLAILVLVQVSWAGACLGQAPKAATAPPGTKAYVPKPYIRYPRPPRETSHVRLGQLPSNMPVPVPTDAKFIMGYQSQCAMEPTTTYVRMSTDNVPATVVEWFRKNMRAYGWDAKEQASSKPGGLPTICGTKGKVTCVVNFGTMAKKAATATVIMLTFNEPR